MKTTLTRPARLSNLGQSARQRAVLFDPQGPSGPRWVDTCAEYAAARNCDVVAIAARLEDALRHIAGGFADVLVVPRASDLAPLIQIVTAPPGAVTPANRRPRRLR